MKPLLWSWSLGVLLHACGGTRATQSGAAGSPPPPEPGERTEAPRGPGSACTPSKDPKRPPGTGSQGNCAEGLLCCESYQGGCGGVEPMPGEEREPCVVSYQCAAVAECWGPPP